MTKRIGILGGISAESTAEYYTCITRGYYARRGDDHYPEIVIYSLDFRHFTDFEDNGNCTGYIAYIMTGIRALERAGAEFILMSANSPHSVFDEVEALANVPMLSIVKATAERAGGMGLKRLLLLGIKYTMQSTFYQDTCRDMGIEVVTPVEPEQDEINRIVFEELARGIFRQESKQRLLQIIARYPVDGVILGCTELPLILKAPDAAIPLLDTVELHTQAVLDYALSGTN
jgi:aspartate racemase